MEEWTAKDKKEIAANTLRQFPLPSPLVRTKPAATKQGDEANTVLVKCGWCNIGRLGTIETENGTPYWREARAFPTSAGLDKENRMWKQGEDYVWRVDPKASAIYGKGKARLRIRQRLANPKDMAEDPLLRGKGWELVYNNDRMDNLPLARIPVIAMECPCRDCHGVTLVDLKLFAVEWSP